MSNFSDYMGDKTLGQWLRLGDSSGTTATDSSGNGNDGSYEGTYTLGQTGLVTGDSDTAVLLGSDGKVNLGDITTFENAGTAGYDIREAFKPTSNYGAGTAREVWLNATDGTDGLEVAYETGNLEITHGLETYQIATTYTSGEIYRLILSYNASTKLLEVYQNDSLLGSNTFTNALEMPDKFSLTSFDKTDVSTSVEAIVSSYELSSGRLLFGSGSGSGDGDLWYSDDKGESVTKISLPAIYDYVWCIIQLPSGRVMIGCGAGSGDGDILFSDNIDASTPSFNNIEVSTALEDARTLCILDSGRVLLGSGSSAGDGDIWYCDDPDGLLPTFTKAELGETTIEGVYSMIQLSSGRVMFSTGADAGDGDVWYTDNPHDSPPNFTKTELGANIRFGLVLLQLESGRVVCGTLDTVNGAELFYTDNPDASPPTWNSTTIGAGLTYCWSALQLQDGRLVTGCISNSLYVSDDPDASPPVFSPKATGETFDIPYSLLELNDRFIFTSGFSSGSGDIYYQDAFQYYIGGQRTVDEFSYEEDPTDAADVADDYTVFTGGSLEKIVPNVTGLSLSDAQNAITASGFVYGGVEYIYNKDYDNNIVLTQSPKAGEEHAGETFIYLTVSYNTVYKTILCYDNLCTQSGVTVVASSTATGTFVENLYDDATYDYWKSAEV